MRQSFDLVFVVTRQTSRRSQDHRRERSAAQSDAIRQGVADTLASYGNGPGHVFNLGHGMTPDIEPDNLGVLVDAVHELSPRYHL